MPLSRYVLLRFEVFGFESEVSIVRFAAYQIQHVSHATVCRRLLEVSLPMCFARLRGTAADTTSENLEAVLHTPVFSHDSENVLKCLSMVRVLVKRSARSH